MSKFQQDGLEHVPTGGDGLRQSPETIWSPYGPYLQPRRGPFSPPPCSPVPHPNARRPQEESCGSWVPSGRTAGTWPLSVVHAPPGLWSRRSLNSARTVSNWRKEIRLSWDTRSVIGSPGIWVTETASVEACRRISHRGPAPQHFWKSPRPHAPLPTAAPCKACLAALPCTHCPWQLHRAGPRAQIMQPAQLPNQARLGGDLHQIREPQPLAQYHGDEMLLLLFHLALNSCSQQRGSDS